MPGYPILPSLSRAVSSASSSKITDNPVSFSSSPHFEIVMSDIFSFLDHSPSKKLINDIQKTAEKQKIYKSKHKYDLKKFGLSEKKIKKDCLPIYETFLK